MDRTTSLTVGLSVGLTAVALVVCYYFLFLYRVRHVLQPDRAGSRWERWTGTYVDPGAARIGPLILAFPDKSAAPSAVGPLPPYASSAEYEAMEKGAIRKQATPEAQELPPTKDGYYPVHNSNIVPRNPSPLKYPLSKTSWRLCESYIQTPAPPPQFVNPLDVEYGPNPTMLKYVITEFDPYYILPRQSQHPVHAYQPSTPLSDSLGETKALRKPPTACVSETLRELDETPGAAELPTPPKLARLHELAELADAIENELAAPATPSDLYQCSHCGIKFPKAYLLNKHITRKHERRYKCNICDVAFALNADLARHQRSKHRDDARGEVFSCPNPSCKTPTRTYNRRDNWLRHVRGCTPPSDATMSP